MSTPKVTIHNAETGEIIERDMNAEELAQYQIDVERDAQRAADLAAKEASKTAILDRLGLTAEEAKVLLS
jgi:phosphopantetheinyl transferase (holo-ACP synthase)